MNILIAEYFTGGGLCGHDKFGVPEQLYREGGMMLRALAEDLAQIEGVHLVTTRDARLPPPDFKVQAHVISEDEDWTPCLHELLTRVDAFWPIAPETDGALESLCELGERSGLLLNSTAAAVRLTASKRRTAAALGAAGVPCVETVGIDEMDEMEARNGCEQLVLKPDDGVGCESVRLVTAARARELGRPGNVVQPYLEGEAASLSVFYGGGEHCLAAVNRQEIERHGEGFSLKACIVNGLQADSHDWDDLARQIMRAIPGLAGYVGVDCIVCGNDVRVMEINPRLTISYVGLHRSLGVNPAACALSLLSGTPVPCFDLATAVEIRVQLHDYSSLKSAGERE